MDISPATPDGKVAAGRPTSRVVLGGAGGESVAVTTPIYAVSGLLSSTILVLHIMLITTRRRKKITLQPITATRSRGRGRHPDPKTMGSMVFQSIAAGVVLGFYAETKRAPCLAKMT